MLVFKLLGKNYLSKLYDERSHFLGLLYLFFTITTERHIRTINRPLAKLFLWYDREFYILCIFGILYAR
jgi:hypothetical protein